LKTSNAKETTVELIPLRDYYHRHTRSIFWELKDIIPFGDHWLFRWCLGWLMPVRISLLKLTQTEGTRKLYETKHVAQDMLVPMDKIADSINCMEKEFAFYPLWLCPMLLPAVKKNSPAAQALVHAKGKTVVDVDGVEWIPEQMFVDIGVYGSPRIENFDAKEALRNVESVVLHMDGYQALYADSLLSRSDFHKMFDHRLYDRVRSKFNIDDAFPEVYDKVSLSNRR
jgi:delta24-sterol reductase